MNRPHWYIRPLPNVALASCSIFVLGLFWALGLRAPTSMLLAGAIVGVLDGALGLLAQRTTARHLRDAWTYGDVILAFARSPWTRARNLIGIVSLVTLGIVLVPRISDSKTVAIIVLFSAYTAVSFLLRALLGWLVFKQPTPNDVPANNALERARER